MRIAVTGARGFVGHWLTAELEAAGHVVVPSDQPEIDIRDTEQLRVWLAATAPDAVAHLAGMAFGPDARADPAEAISVNVGGTVALLDVVGAMPRPPAVLVSGSADVYAPPASGGLLSESDPLGPTAPYGVSKLAQEQAALKAAREGGLAVVVTRSFNHTGPGQRPVFVVPALAGRIAAVAAGRSNAVVVGNLDVRRDFMDVRDVVVAYRLLLEALAEGRLERGGLVMNVASGRSVAIRDIVSDLCAIAGVDPAITVDPALVRPNEPSVIAGDPSQIRAATGWTAQVPWRQTLDDVYSHVERTMRGG